MIESRRWRLAIPGPGSVDTGMAAKVSFGGLRALGFGLVCGTVAACGGPGGDPPDNVGDVPSMELDPNALSQAAALAASCSGCHRGGSEVTPVPGILGLDADVLEGTLLAYRADTAGTTVMHRIARGYSEDELSAIAAYLGEAS